jgi:hypothetical protein
MPETVVSESLWFSSDLRQRTNLDPVTPSRLEEEVLKYLLVVLMCLSCRRKSWASLCMFKIH